MSFQKPLVRIATLALLSLVVSTLAPAWLAHAHGLGAPPELAWRAVSADGADSNALAHDSQHCRVCQHRKGADRLVLPAPSPAHGSSAPTERIRPDSPALPNDFRLSGNRHSRAPPASR